VVGWATFFGRANNIGMLPATDVNLASYPQRDRKLVPGRKALMLGGWVAKTSMAHPMFVDKRLCWKEVCVQLITPADNVTLLAFATERQPCSNRSISPARRVHSSKPAEAACSGQMTGRMDRRMDALHTMRAVSIIGKTV